MSRAPRVILAWLERPGQAVAEAVCRFLTRVFPELDVVVPATPLAGAPERSALARRLVEYDGLSLALVVVTADSSMAGWVGAAVSIAGGEPGVPARDGAWLVPLGGSVGVGASVFDDKGVPLDEAGLRRLVADLARLVGARPSSVLKAFDAAWPTLAAALEDGPSPDRLRRAPRHPHDAAALALADSPRELLEQAARRLVPTFVVGESNEVGVVALHSKVPTSGQELVWAVRTVKEALNAAGFRDARVELHAPLRIDGGRLPPVTVSFDGSLAPRRGPS